MLCDVVSFTLFVICGFSLFLFLVGVWGGCEEGVVVGRGEGRVRRGCRLG